MKPPTRVRRPNALDSAFEAPPPGYARTLRATSPSHMRSPLAWRRRASARCHAGTRPRRAGLDPCAPSCACGDAGRVASPPAPSIDAEQVQRHEPAVPSTKAKGEDFRRGCPFPARSDQEAQIAPFELTLVSSAPDVAAGLASSGPSIFSGHARLTERHFTRCEQLYKALNSASAEERGLGTGGSELEFSL